jgi:predicted Ser/Thr protein kinase
MAQESLEGRTVGDRWRIESPLARGGMSTVYLGRDEQTGEPVAVKILRPDLKPELRSAERFQREARAASRLDHPNIVAIRGHGEFEGGQFFLVMEYIDGVSLQKAIFEDAPFGARRALRVAAQIAEALAHAHENKVFHRDLKPGNVVLVHRPKEPDMVKVLDFGLAKIQGHDEADTLTRAGLVFGTPEYMSPEQACGGEVDGRCDVYACGAILFEMLAGRPPFVGSGVFDTLRKQVIDPPPPFAEIRPDVVVHSLVERIVLRCLEKQPENRFASAAQLARALRAAGRHLATPRSKRDSSGAVDSQMPTMGQDRAILLDADEAAKAEYEQLRRHRQETLRRAAALLDGARAGLQVRELLDRIGLEERAELELGAELAVIDHATEEVRLEALENISRLRLANIDTQMEATRLREQLRSVDDEGVRRQLTEVGEELVRLERQLWEAERTLASRVESLGAQRDGMRARISERQELLDACFDELAALVRSQPSPTPGSDLFDLIEDLDSFDRWIAAHKAIAGGTP